MTKLAYMIETIPFLRRTVNLVDGRKYSWDILSFGQALGCLDDSIEYLSYTLLGYSSLATLVDSAVLVWHDERGQFPFTRYGHGHSTLFLWRFRRVCFQVIRLDR